jgi:hypothetical protein
VQGEEQQVAGADLGLGDRVQAPAAGGGVLRAARGIAWVEVDLAVLRGEREPALTLFAA